MSLVFKKMNLADPELELIDPTPNVHSLFVHFDDLFFWTKLKGRALVRWSKRMYSCAGVCSYEGRGGLCDIALSEPLLKLRPRKDLIETLLHEMIHAFLFITNNDNDRDGHGPTFKAHMHRINTAAGLNISIYHDFHDEVKLYLKHWWRCNGRCQKLKPYFGVVRRSLNRAPGPHDYWWKNHAKTCGGTFIKIKEPEKPEAKKAIKKTDKNKNGNNNITKYINNNNDAILNKNVAKGVNKENKVTSINVSTAVPPCAKSPEIRNLVDLGRKRTNSASVIETVRNVWANKQIPSLSGATRNSVKSQNSPNLIKHRTNTVDVEPPKKIMKIDDYFKSNASSILKDVYGEEFIISQSSNSTKLKAVTVGQSSKVPPVNIFVDCPSCNAKVYSNDINKHLDECLNKNIIEKLSKDSIQEISTNAIIDRKSKDLGNAHQFPEVKLKTEINIENDDKTKLKTIVGSIQTIPPFKCKTGNQTASTSKDDTSHICPSCGDKVNMPIELHIDKCLGFFDNNTTIPEEGVSNMETIVIDGDFNPLNIKSEPGTSNENFVQKCPCCGEKIYQPIELHLDECLGFFDNNTTMPTEGASGIETIVIDNDDDDDIFDESQTLNATGTKSPCPCCLKMIELADMNDHLDVCLSTSQC